MGNSRDDFTSATKELLANRVGRRCSNPACRKLTCGANTNPEKITNIGVAAHICAAAQGGPRYDASMTPEERKSFENGIWLCQSCSKLIDTDITRYPKELLQSWKQLAEQTAILEVETTSSTPAFEKDKELVQFYLECFDRPAFQDDIYQEGRMEDFDKAIEDTLIALNTGVLRTRDGSILKQADGKSSVQNSLWREKLYTITDMLTAIRRRLKIAKKEKAYSTYGTGEDVAYCFYDRELAEWLNSTREEILKILSSICKEAGLRELHFRNCFCIPTTVVGEDRPYKNHIPVLTSKGVIYVHKDDISDAKDILGKYKVVITYAMSGGNKPTSDGNYQVISSLKVLNPNEACSETYLVIDTFDEKEKAENLVTYLSTKFCRFLLLQALTSIHITKDKFCFVPVQDCSKSWTDAELYAKYNLTEEEIAFIESMIKPMELGGDD